MRYTLFIISTLLLTVGCLQTRHQIKRQEASYGRQPQSNSSSNLQLDDINHDFRKLYGRVEVVENKMQKYEEQPEVNNLKVKLAEMETKIALLEQTIAKLNTEYKKGGLKKTGLKKTTLQKANEFYNSEKWEDAIITYEKYRKDNPKGNSYLDATYKIGMSFKKLGMKEDAKAFFKEAIDRNGKSIEAKRSKSQLQSL